MQLFKRKEIEISGDKFSYLNWKGMNNKKNLFFFHATGFNGLTYHPLLSEIFLGLDKEYSIYAMDQRGHGLSNAKALPVNLNSWDVYFEDAKKFITLFEPKEIITAGHSMGAVVSAKAAFDFEKKIKTCILIDPVLQTQSFKYRSPFTILKNKIATTYLTKLLKNRASEMIENAKKRRNIFKDKLQVFEHYSGRGAFKNWPAESLNAYIDGGTLLKENEVHLSCFPEWESKTFSVSYAASTRFIKSLNKKLYIPYASEASTLSELVKSELEEKSNFYLEKIEGSHFFPMERKDFINKKIVNFIKEIDE